MNVRGLIDLKIYQAEMTIGGEEDRVRLEVSARRSPSKG
jgi:hypothetical protein